MPSEPSALLAAGLILGLGLVLGSVLLTLLWIARTADALARVVGLELLVGLTTALFVGLGIWQGSSFYVEVALLIALLGFVATIAFARLGQAENGDPRR